LEKRGNKKSLKEEERLLFIPTGKKSAQMLIRIVT
jgi:hypothetical protein